MIFINRITVLICCLIVATLSCTPSYCAEDSRETVRDNIIIVGGEKNYPPYEFIDSEGVPSGFNVDLMLAIARVMGMRVEFRLGDWSEVFKGLHNGKIDVLEGIAYSDGRATKVDFTPPHTIVHHAIFARKGSFSRPTLASLRGKEVVVLADGIVQDLLAANDTGAIVVRVGSHSEVLRLLSSGKHDYAIVAKLPGLHLIRELGLSNLEAVGVPVTSQKYCFAVRKGNSALLAQLNEGLAILKNTGEYQRIYNKWYGVLEPTGISWSQALKFGAVIFIPLMLTIGLMTLWSKTLKREVDMRTAELTREVSERRHAEEELRTHQQQLLQADKMTSLGTLVSGVAHEINNPNGLVLLNMPVMLEAFRDAEPILDEYYTNNGDFEFAGLRYSRMREVLPKLMNQMLEGSRRVNLIVDDLKNFARQQEPGAVADVDLNQVVSVALRLVSNLVEKSTNRLVVSCCGDLPLIRGNAQRIEQVVVNLVMNSCQALPDKERAVFVTTFVDTVMNMVVLEVRDEGNGIPPEHLSQITAPFFTTKREIGGTGLGLSVSAGIVKEHGGMLSFNSKPGAGTTAQLILPIP